MLNKLYATRNSLINLANSLALTDNKCNTSKKINILNNTIEHIKKEKRKSKIIDKYFLNLNEDELCKSKIYFIRLLRKSKVNHIEKDTNGRYYYRFIIELFNAEKELKKYLETVQKDVNCYKYLNKKYNITPPTELLEAIELAKLKSNQVIPYLYLLEATYINNTNTMKELFSIIFYGIPNQRSFIKNLKELEIKLENAPLDLLPSLNPYLS